MKLLALECSAVCASVAVMEDGRVTGEFFVNTRQTHSQTLMPMVQQVLVCTNTRVQDVDVFAVAAGPGSFTGVRIGVSCVKGMAFAAGKPCFGVSALEALAYRFTAFDGVICAVMDARCGQVYYGLFRVKNGLVTRLQEDQALAITEVAAALRAYQQEPIFVVGDGAELCCKTPEFETLSAHLAPEELRFAHAVGVALCAEKKLAEGMPTVTAQELRPTYLRLPQAERELKKKLEEIR